MLLLLLIGGELVQYFNRKPSKTTFASEESSLPLIVGLQRNPAMKQSRIVIPERVVQAKDTNVEAAKIWAVYRDLQGETIKEDELKILSSSKEYGDRAFGRALTAQKLKADESARVDRSLGKGEANDYARLRAREKAGLEADWGVFTSRATAAGIGVALIILACGLGCVLIVLYLAARQKGNLIPLGHPALPMSQAATDIYASRVALILILVLFGPLLINFATMRAPGTGLISPLVIISVVLWLCRKPVAGVRLDRWRFGNSIVGLKAMGAGALIYLMGLPFIVTATILGSQIFSFLPAPEHPATKMIPSATPYQLAVIFVSAVIQAPIVEEIAFRGTLLPAMMRQLNRPVLALILTNLIFAAIHPTGIPAWPALAMIGIVGSFAVYQTGSIIPAITIHALHNGALLIFSLLITR